MSRTVFDCARIPGDTCSLLLIGELEEVLSAAVQHLVAAHGHPDEAGLRRNIARVVEENGVGIPYSSWA